MLSLVGSALKWKTPTQYVWDNKTFSENGLELESKTTIHHIIQQHALAEKAFFIIILNLLKARVNKLLADLALMQKEDHNNPEQVH